MRSGAGIVVGGQTRILGVMVVGGRGCESSRREKSPTKVVVLVVLACIAMGISYCSRELVSRLVRRVA